MPTLVEQAALFTVGVTHAETHQLLYVNAGKGSNHTDCRYTYNDSQTIQLSVIPLCSLQNRA